MLLEGLYIPLTTPFHPDGRLNSQKFASNVARYSKTPASGLIVLGPSGEPTLLSDDETRASLRAAVEAAAPEKVLLAGVSRDSVHATLTLAEFAASLSYDAILVAAPFNLDATQTRELLLYFQTVADRSPVPVMLLSTTTQHIPARMTAALAIHPNILGLYDAKMLEAPPAEVSESMSHSASVRRNVTVTPTFTAVTARMIQAAASTERRATLISAASLGGSTSALAELTPAALPLRTRSKAVGFQRIAGASAHLLDALGTGASAIAPTFAACAPQACYEIFAAWKDADQPLAEEKQTRLNPAARYAEALGPGGLKFGCDLNGYFGGVSRLPLLPPTALQRAELENLMEGMRN